MLDTVVMATPLVAPLLAAAFARARRTPSRAAGWVTVAAAVAILTSGVAAAVLTVDGDSLTAASVLRAEARRKPVSA